MRPSKSSAYFKARSTFFLNFIAVSLFNLKARFSAPTHMSVSRRAQGLSRLAVTAAAPRASTFPGHP